MLLLLVLGCRVIRAPEALEELVVYGFVHYDDDGYAEAVAEELLPKINADFEGLRDGYYVDRLGKQELEQAGVEAPSEVEIIGALGTVEYDHTMEEVIAFISRDDKEEWIEGTTAYDVLEQTDRECFLSQECETYEATIRDVTEIAILGTATRTFFQQYQWIYPEGFDPFVLMRTINPDPVEFSSDILSVSQQYALVAVYNHACKARRLESFWADAEVIGLDVPDSYMVDQTIKQMQTSADNVDEAIDTLLASGETL